VYQILRPVEIYETIFENGDLNTKYMFWNDSTNKYHAYQLSTNYHFTQLYSCEVLNGLLDGQGYCYYEIITQYHGSFKNNSRDGFGQMTYCDGSIYTGEYKDDNRHGKGEQFQYFI
jgi:hypothetical protein